MGKPKLNNNIIDERLKNSNFKRVSNYITNKIPIELECLIHSNFKWSVRPDHLFTRKQSCPKCSKQERYSNELLDEKMKGRNIKRVGNCLNNRDKIEFECNIDGYKWKASPSSIINSNSGCPMCYGNIKLTNEDIDNKLINRNIERIGDITNKSNKEKIEWKCLICNNIWIAGSSSIINRKRGCPLCKFKNERKVKNMIIDNVIYSYFKHQKIIWIGKRFFRVDFYIEKDGVKYIIEYNGEQHYRPIRFSGISKEKSIVNFYKQIYRDNLIIDYCKLNNITLIEIPFYLNDKETLDIFKSI